MQFGALCRILGVEGLASDERYATNAQRLKHRATLIPVLSELFARSAKAHWLDQLERAGVPCGPIQSIPEALADEHVLARGMVFSLPHSSGNPAPQIANPIKFSRSRIHYRRAPPALGEHTDEVLATELGWSAERIADLKRKGVI